MSIYNLHDIEKHAVPPHIVVTTQQDYPYSGYINQSNKLVGTGYAFEILDLMSDYFNFTYSIKVPEGNPENDLEAVISQLLNKEVDVAVAFIPILPELGLNYTYGTVLDEMELTFFMKRPPESATGSGLLAPFDSTVWILILITVLFVGPSIYFLVTLRLNIITTFRSKFTKDAKPEKYSLSECMWFVYGALLKQGAIISPISSSIRLLFATWWIFIIILTAFYTANLTAFLTLSQFTLPINSVETLINKHMKWFAFKGRILDYLMTINHSVFADLRKTFINYGVLLRDDNNTIINYEVLTRIHKNAVFITESLYAKLTLYAYYKENMFSNMKEEERCEFVIMPSNIFKINRAFAFSTRSTIYRQFNRITRKLIEGGLIKFYKSRDLPEAIICPLDLGSKERNLRLADLKLTYNLVFTGFIISSGIFIGELLYKYYFKDKFENQIANSTEQPALSKINSDSKIMHEKWIKAYDNIAKNNNYIQTINVSPPSKMNANIKNINGREYYVIKQDNQGFQLIPIRSPSAIMYQFYRQTK